MHSILMIGMEAIENVEWAWEEDTSHSYQLLMIYYQQYDNCVMM